MDGETTRIALAVALASPILLFMGTVLKTWLDSRSRDREIKSGKETELGKQQAELQANADSRRVANVTQREQTSYERGEAEIQYLRKRSDEHQAAIDVLNARIHSLEMEALKAETKRGAEVSQLREDLTEVKRQLAEALLEIKRLTAIIQKADAAGVPPSKADDAPPDKPTTPPDTAAVAAQAVGTSSVPVAAAGGGVKGKGVEIVSDEFNVKVVPVKKGDDTDKKSK